MNLQEYKERRQKMSEQEPKFRDWCLTCRQPDYVCYCPHLHRVESKIQFAILIHPLENRRRIATGRMAHLSLPNSHLIAGHEFSRNEVVRGLLSNPNNQCAILYPGVASRNLSTLSPTERQSYFAPGLQPVVFVVDGTWATAGKMLRHSENLLTLPQICFSPSKPSMFRVRKQPAPQCYSTIEAIHHTLSLFADDETGHSHDKLLYPFDWMVERQLEFINESRSSGRSVYRREA